MPAYLDNNNSICSFGLSLLIATWHQYKQSIRKLLSAVFRIDYKEAKKLDILLNIDLKIAKPKW